MSTAVSTVSSPDDGIAASPKVRTALDDRNAETASASMALAANTADDGIAASPKVRQQLNERSATFTVAPLK
jgi:hypothetical protein